MGAVRENDMAALAPSLLFLLSLVSTVSSYLDVYPPIDENDARTPLHFAHRFTGKGMSTLSLF